VSADNLDEVKRRALKLSRLADLNELGIYTSASDLSAKRDFLKINVTRAGVYERLLRSDLVWQEQ
jgi:hypothetical protein